MSYGPGSHLSIHSMPPVSRQLLFQPDSAARDYLLDFKLLDDLTANSNCSHLLLRSKLLGHGGICVRRFRETRYLLSRRLRCLHSSATMYRYTMRNTELAIQSYYLRRAGCARVSSSGPKARSTRPRNLRRIFA